MSCNRCARTHLLAPGAHSHAILTAAAERKGRAQQMSETKTRITIIVAEDNRDLYHRCRWRAGHADLHLAKQNNFTRNAKEQGKAFIINILIF